MSKKSDPRPKAAEKTSQPGDGKPSGGKAAEKARSSPKDSIRETVESVVIAFLLAFLFRTFEAEAFVIPTGSMAPTLMGQHKDLVCTQCGYPYRVSASEASDESAETLRSEIKAIERETAQLRKMTAEGMTEEEQTQLARQLAYLANRRDEKQSELSGKEVIACTCPMCRYTMPIDSNRPGDKEYPSYKGDRILVAKFPYEFSDPERWDVAVFKYPETAKLNFIKRIVGLPNETVVLHNGDVLSASPGAWHGELDLELLNQLREEGRLQIQRKPVAKVLAMLQAVYDNDYVLSKLIQRRWPPRWKATGQRERSLELSDYNKLARAETLASGNQADGPAWQAAPDHKSFTIGADAPGEQWLRYRHFVPTADDWDILEERGLTDQELAKVVPRLVTDFYAYNTGRLRRDPSEYDTFGLHWVGDLALECEATIKGSQGELVLELVEGGRKFRCRIDLSKGLASLEIDGLPGYGPQASCGVAGPGSYELRFANVDDQLLLWVDGDLVEFQDETAYGDLDNQRPAPDDLAPVGIGARGAAVRVGHLRVLRDVYYIADGPAQNDRLLPTSTITEYRSTPSARLREQRLRGLFPAALGEQSDRHIVAMELREDEFLVLGDNSPRSKDSRLWTGVNEQGRREYFVHRDLLIGKALYVYWPHALDHLPGRPDSYFPFFPNVGRMGLVR